jgi:hypothetical protein
MSNFLLHIGYPKTGSTFLHEWFNQHPQLFHTYGIAGFTDPAEMSPIPVKPSKPGVKFQIMSDVNLATGWVNPNSFLSLNEQIGWLDRNATERRTHMCRHLHECFPTARILLTTRGFKGYILSSYSEYLKHGGTLNLKELRNAFPESQHVLDLNSVIRDYLDTFGAERLLVLPYELLREDQNRFLRQIEDWLELNHFECQLGRVNPSLAPEDLRWYPRISRVVSMFSNKLPAKWGKPLYRQYVNRLTSKYRLHPLVRVLNRLNPPSVGHENFSQEYLSGLEDKATLLRSNPLYTPYAAEYLWAA